MIFLFFDSKKLRRRDDIYVKRWENLQTHKTFMENLTITLSFTNEVTNSV